MALGVSAEGEINEKIKRSVVWSRRRQDQHKAPDTSGTIEDLFEET